MDFIDRYAGKYLPQQNNTQYQIGGAPARNEFMQSAPTNQHPYVAPLSGLGTGAFSAGDIKRAGKQSFFNQFSSSQQLDPNNMTWSNHLFGGTDNLGNVHGGIGGGLLDIGKTGMGVWLGLKHLGLAEDSLDFQKDAFSKQFTAQGTLTNAELRDRQDRRNRERPDATPTDEYMKQNAVQLG